MTFLNSRLVFHIESYYPDVKSGGASKVFEGQMCEMSCRVSIPGTSNGCRHLVEVVMAQFSF